MAWTLVTGASDGIGEEFVRQLARKGHNVVLVARREHLLKAIASEVSDRYNVMTEVMRADLCNEDDLQRVKDRLNDDRRPIDLLVNCAGMGIGRPFLQSTLTRQDQALCTMVRATMHLSHVAANHMKARGHGAICNISSLGAYTGMATYGANKTWVDIFTRSLHAELYGSGVTATSVRPGFTDTGFFERMGWSSDWFPEWLLGAPRLVAVQALHGVSRGRPVVTPRLLTAISVVILRLIPKSIAYPIAQKIHERLLPL